MVLYGNRAIRNSNLPYTYIHVREANQEIPKLEIFKTCSKIFRNSYCIIIQSNGIRAINCSFARDLYKSLGKRIEARGTVYSSPLNFLKNPNNESDFDKDLDTTLIEFKLKVLILCFAKGPKKTILYHSISILYHSASQMRTTLLPLIKSYLTPSKNSKAL